MKIKFNEVTWYSKLLAFILFVFIIPVLTFYIGSKFGEYKTLEMVYGTGTLQN